MEEKIMNKQSLVWLEKLVAKESQKENPVKKISIFKKILLSLFL